MLNLSEATIVVFIVCFFCMILLTLGVVMIILENEQGKVKRIKTLIQEWDNKRGHDKCWYYPEIFEDIAKVVNVPLINNQPCVPRTDFRNNCQIFEAGIYSKND